MACNLALFFHDNLYRSQFSIRICDICLYFRPPYFVLFCIYKDVASKTVSIYLLSIFFHAQGYRSYSFDIDFCFYVDSFALEANPEHLAFAFFATPPPKETGKKVVNISVTLRSHNNKNILVSFNIVLLLSNIFMNKVPVEICIFFTSRKCNYIYFKIKLFNDDSLLRLNVYKSLLVMCFR